MITPSTLHPIGKLRRPEFLLKNNLLDKSGAAAAVLLGPGQAGPSRVIELFCATPSGAPHTASSPARFRVFTPGERWRPIRFEPIAAHPSDKRPVQASM